MNNNSLAEAVEQAARQRGDSAVPLDYINEAIRKINQGLEKVHVGFFSRKPCKKGIYQVAAAMFREACLEAERSRLRVGAKYGTGMGATIDIYRGQSKRRVGLIEFDDDDTWIVSECDDTTEAQVYCDAVCLWAQKEYPFG